MSIDKSCKPVGQQKLAQSRRTRAFPLNQLPDPLKSGGWSLQCRADTVRGRDQECKRRWRTPQTEKDKFVIMFLFQERSTFTPPKLERDSPLREWPCSAGNHSSRNSEAPSAGGIGTQSNPLEPRTMTALSVNIVPTSSGA
jgi:hypothetical protein